MIDFHRTKYGREILIDIEWIHGMPTFIIDRPHALTFYDITLITRGRGRFALDGHSYPVEAGRVFFTSPGAVRQWDVTTLDGICLFFPVLFLAEFFSDAMFLHRLPYFHVDPGEASMTLGRSAAATLQRKLLAMRDELRARRADSTHMLRAALYERLIALGRDYSAQHGGARERAVHPVVARFRELVDRDVRRRHRIADYASELAVSPGHLSTLCRRHLGRSAKRVLQERLTLEARRLLLYSDESAESIGYSLGFEDPSYFSRFFRAATGRSPSEFRAGVESPACSPDV